MFFWIALPLVFLAFVGAFVWGVRGYAGRFHEPGTQHLVDGPSGRKAERRSARRSGGHGDSRSDGDSDRSGERSG